MYGGNSEGRQEALLQGTPALLLTQRSSKMNTRHKVVSDGPWSVVKLSV